MRRLKMRTRGAGCADPRFDGTAKYARNRKPRSQEKRWMAFFSLFLILAALRVSLPGRIAVEDSHHFAQNSTRSQDVVSVGSSDPISSNVETDHIMLVIGVKTAENGVHGQRLPQIERTWQKDALNMGVDLKFFTHSQPQGDPTQSLIINTPCQDSNLCCKNEQMLAYFLEHTTKGTASYFCSFDDDNYVLIPNLLEFLTSYQNGTKQGRGMYIGKTTWGDGMPVKRLNRTRVQFLTGGAGYCMSRDVVEQGRDYFLSLDELCKRTGAPDDVMIGYVVQEKVGPIMTIDRRFNSHFQKLRSYYRREEIHMQFSFGFDNKRKREDSAEYFPDVPILFSASDDPMLFRSLWCFLNRENTEVDTVDCGAS